LPFNEIALVLLMRSIADTDVECFGPYISAVEAMYCAIYTNLRGRDMAEYWITGMDQNTLITITHIISIIQDDPVKYIPCLHLHSPRDHQSDNIIPNMKKVHQDMPTLFSWAKRETINLR
jgi:hypothetical protein